MSKAVRSRSTKRVHKNRVAAGTVSATDEDFLAGVLAGVDVDAISRPNPAVSVAQYVFARWARRERNLFVREQRVSVKVVAAINSMNKRGHHARIYRYQDKMEELVDKPFEIKKSLWKIPGT